MPTASQPPDKFTHALVTVQSLYESYLAPSLPPPVASVLDSLLTNAIRAQPFISQLTSIFTSLITSLTGMGGGSVESTALLSTAVMIISLYLSLRVFNYVRRMVMGWIVFVLKVVLVLLGMQVLLYVNQYGWENAIRDASWWGGIVWGFVEEVLEGNKDAAGTARAPRGTRSRGSARHGGQYDYYGRQQVPVGGGRARWT